VCVLRLAYFSFIYLDFFSSYLLKLEWAFLIARYPSVCLSGHLSVSKFFNFYSKTIVPILTRLGTNHPWVEEIQVCSGDAKHLSPSGDNNKRMGKKYLFLNKIFSKTSQPISSNLAKEMQVCSNKRPCPLQKGDTFQKCKIRARRIPQHSEPERHNERGVI
jgi:hypothetical protein